MSLSFAVPPFTLCLSVVGKEGKCFFLYSLFILLSQEVFRTDVFDSIPFSAVVGRCYVMYVKDYFKNKPEVSI